MRNDARPLGHDKPPIPERPPRDVDSRQSVTHDRQSHIVNRRAEENARREDADNDPALPTGDSTLRTTI